MATFKERLKELRKEKSITIEKLAEDLLAYYPPFIPFRELYVIIIIPFREKVNHFLKFFFIFGNSYIFFGNLSYNLLSAKSTISRYENGLREPKKDFLEMLSQYFNVSVDYLLGRTNERNLNKEVKLNEEITTIS